LNEQKRRKRSKKVFEELRSQDSTAATFFSPTKIQQAIDLQEHKEQAKADEKRQKAIDNEAKKVQHQLRLEETAASVAVARAAKVRQKEADKDNRLADQQLQQQLQQSVKRTRSRKPTKLTESVRPLNLDPPQSGEGSQQLALRSGRVPRKPKHLNE
jgi:hypothetical protein